MHATSIASPSKIQPDSLFHVEKTVMTTKITQTILSRIGRSLLSIATPSRIAWYLKKSRMGHRLFSLCVLLTED